MRIERFEDIKAWQEARALTNMVYNAVISDKGFERDYKFREKIQRAAVSIMSNIAEGFSRRSTKEFTQFLFISKGSAAEIQSQLYVALDQGYISPDKFEALFQKADEIARLISGFIQYLLRNEQSKPHRLNQLNQRKELNQPHKSS